MTQNWNFNYLSPPFAEYMYLPITMPDFLRKITESITYDPSLTTQITYPYFLIRVHNLATGGTVECYPALGPFVVENTYAIMYIFAFDNLGGISYDVNYHNGFVNVQAFGGNFLKIEVIEMTSKVLDFWAIDNYEKGVVWSGMANFKNAQNPDTEFKEYGEEINNTHNSTTPVYKEYKTNG
tara:strand:+ start:14914 stop:15456 length:543 start_codon:yes stop_codon:yes gene_type:complete